MSTKYSISVAVGRVLPITTTIKQVKELLFYGG
jgi:hypothetical protein